MMGKLGLESKFSQKTGFLGYFWGTFSDIKMAYNWYFRSLDPIEMGILMRVFWSRYR